MSKNQHIIIVIVYFFTEVHFHVSFYFYLDFSISELFTLFLSLMFLQNVKSKYLIIQAHWLFCAKCLLMLF